MTIRNAIVPITGFTQNIGRENGFDCLWEDLRGLVSEETTLITPLRWCDNMKHTADFMWRHMSQEDHCILVVAYSYGGGWGSIQLAKELNKRGLRIRFMMLCDPVYRSRFLLMRWRAMVNRIPFLTPKIKIPPSVREVFWYYQRQNKPQAHQLVPVRAGGPVLDGEISGEEELFYGTYIHQGQQLTGLNHEFMDDSEIFHKNTVKWFTEVLEKRK